MKLNILELQSTPNNSFYFHFQLKVHPQPRGIYFRMTSPLPLLRSFSSETQNNKDWSKRFSLRGSKKNDKVS